jgi:hypothetical protein
MALSPQDKAFYEEKLQMKSLYILCGATSIMGGLMWPSLIFLQDWSIGQTSMWTANVAFHLFLMGFLLGLVVSVIMYLILKFLLEMGWLPSRR